MEENSLSHVIERSRSISSQFTRRPTFQVNASPLFLNDIPHCSSRGDKKPIQIKKIIDTNINNVFKRKEQALQSIVLDRVRGHSRLRRAVKIDSLVISSTVKTWKRRKKKQLILSNSSIRWSNVRSRRLHSMNMFHPVCSHHRIRSSFKIHCKNDARWQNRWVKH